MQRYREAKLDGLIGQLADLRRQATRGDRDLARANASRPWGVQNFEGAQEVVIVGQRFPHAHDNEVADQPAGASAGSLGFTVCGRGLLLVPAFNAEHLLDNLLGLKISFPAFETARTEFAAIGATDLRGNTKRMAVARFTIQGGIGRDENAFD